MICAAAALYKGFLLLSPYSQTLYSNVKRNKHMLWCMNLLRHLTDVNIFLRLCQLLITTAKQN